MAQIDDAAIVAAQGHVYVAPTGTAKPATITDPLDPGVEWKTIGHTNLEELPEFGRDGDDPVTLGSWQNAALRNTSPKVVYSVTFQSIQSTELTYQMYFGAGAAATQADGSFRIPSSPVAQEKALLFILVDGENFVPLYHPKVSLLGSDAVAMASDNFVSYPIKATLLGSSLIGNAIGEWASISGA